LEYLSGKPVFLPESTLRRPANSDLITRLQTAVRESRLSHQEAGRFLKFNGYTNLEEPGD